MAKKPLPDRIPGEFFVLVWDPMRETFILHLDDGGVGSSYDVGGDPNAVSRTLRLRVALSTLPPSADSIPGGRNAVLSRFLDQAVDLAREFRCCQCIPRLLRNIQILPDDARNPTQPSVFPRKDQPDEAAWLPGLP